MLAMNASYASASPPPASAAVSAVSVSSGAGPGSGALFTPEPPMFTAALPVTAARERRLVPAGCESEAITPRATMAAPCVKQNKF